MKQIKTNSILDHEFFNFDYSLDFLSEEELTSLRKVGGLAYYFQGEHNETEFALFTRFLMEGLMENYRIYVVLTESFPSSKSRLKSHQKLLYAQRNQLTGQAITEIEMDVQEGKSILAAMIRLDNENFLIDLSYLLSGNFAFAYFVKKGTKGFSNRDRFLEEMVINYTVIEKTVWINYAKLAQKLATPNSFILRRSVDGSDNLSLEFYALPINIDSIDKLASKKINFRVIP